jgi:hypothetical protein
MPLTKTITLTTKELAPVKALTKPVQGAITKDAYLRSRDVFVDWAGNLPCIGGYAGFAMQTGLTLEQAETIWKELESQMS